MFNFPLRFRSPSLSLELVELLDQASQRARSYEHDYVGAEHVFLCIGGLPDDHLVKQVLSRLPVDTKAFMADLEAQSKVIIERKVPEQLPYTPRLKHVLRHAKTIAKAGKARHVDAVHLLGAIAVEGNSLVTHVFRQHLKANSKWTNADALAAWFATLVVFPQARVFSSSPDRKETQHGTPPVRAVATLDAK